LRQRRTILQLLLAAVVLAGVADLVAVKRGLLHHGSAPFAAIVLTAAALLAAELALTVRDALRREGRARAIAKSLALAGVLVALGGGTANWLFSLQGFVVLAEGDAVALAGGAQLHDYEAGLLADARELEVSLRLEKLELVAAESGFVPESRLVITDAAGTRRVDIAPGRAATHGTLSYHQGAFGFAPRIVILENGREVFDETVPFTTRREGPQGVAFEGELEVEKEGLSLRGAVSLESLDEAMRGHPLLGMELRKGAAVLGAGELSPGHFAELPGGFRVGFAGLKKWTELDVRRRNYRTPMLAGAAIALCGGLAWSALALGGRRRR
jgi:hypothetical protein